MPMLKPRRKTIVNREVQFDILMYVGLLISSLFIMQVVAAFIFLHQFQKIAQNMSALEFISRHKISFLVYESIPLLACLVLSVSIFNRFSIRIVGPLFNMKRVLRRAKNNPESTEAIRLREGDYFRDEINDVNDMLKRKY